MGWKTILVQNDWKLSLKNNHLILESDDDKLKYYLEDLDFLIIDNVKSIITVQILIEIANYNISLLINNRKHEPHALYLPINFHSKILKNFQLQMELIDRDKNKAHQKIIQQKIKNQRLLLENSQLSSEKIDLMKKYENSVLQGDSKNREAISARIFFKELYGSSFIRFNDDGINKALNFGYKILATRISTAIVKFGLNPSLGVFHKGRENYFNLSYDFIEPFRPLVDMIVSLNSEKINDNLSLITRLELIKILDYKVHIFNSIQTVRNAIDIVVKSYVSFLQSKNVNDLELPEISFFKDGEN